MIARRMFDFPAISWRNPFAEMERMARQMDALAGTMFEPKSLRLFSARVFPAANITEDKDNYYVRAELPGMQADEIALEVTGRRLAIAGERKIQSEGENTKYHRREREAGKFSRIIELPGEINAEKVEAKMVNGVLTVSIAKAEATRPKQITIKQ